MQRAMTRLGLFLAAAVCLTHPAMAQREKPLPAQEVVDAAVKKARASKKSTLVLFHASWCGWCRRLDAALNDPDVRKIIGDSYVVVHLDVMEHDDKKALENPGGNTLMADYGGENSGLPFYVFLDAKGKKIADSNAMPKDQNIGYPAAPEEIEAFEKLLKQTAPRLTDAQRGKIVAYLKKNAPRQ